MSGSNQFLGRLLDHWGFRRNYRRLTSTIFDRTIPKLQKVGIALQNGNVDFLGLFLQQGAALVSDLKLAPARVLKQTSFLQVCPCPAPPIAKQVILTTWKQSGNFLWR